MRKGGLPLLQEGRHAFLLIVSCEQSMKQPSLQRQTVLQRQFLRRIHGLLACLHAQSALARDGFRNIQRPLHQFIIREYLRSQSAAVRFIRRPKFSRQRPQHGLGLANGTRQPLRASRPRNDPEIDLRLTELGRLAAHQDIAHHRQFASTSQTKSRNGSDDRRLGTAFRHQRLPLRKHIASCNCLIFLMLHFGYIRTCRECFFGSREYDASNIIGGVIVENRRCIQQIIK
mmetsp:Transcript_14881/g.42109  ORF Transcript_14881/g.42109 Transcript_14881/m.42109 type:complete len:230 (+) Transcript_14881:139-828(+)